jgi:electron transport complex protein RnfC
MYDDVPLLIQNDAITVTPVKTIREEPCLHCGNCIAHCPMNLMPVEINDAARRGDFDKCFDLNVLECVNCGTCSFVCPSHIEVSGQVKQAKLMTTIKCPRAQRKPAPAPKKEPTAEAKK